MKKNKLDPATPESGNNKSIASGSEKQTKNKKKHGLDADKPSDSNQDSSTDKLTKKENSKKHHKTPAKLKKIEKLKEKIEKLKIELKEKNENDFAKTTPEQRLKQEVDHMELEMLTLKFQFDRMQDRYCSMRNKYSEYVELLENLRGEFMDNEELEHLKKIMHFKKNELRIQKDYIQELQKLEWNSLPQKFIDECQQIQTELNNEHCNCNTLKMENIEKQRDLKKSRIERDGLHDEYRALKHTIAISTELFEEITKDEKDMKEIAEAKEYEFNELKAIMEIIEPILKLAQEEEGKEKMTSKQLEISALEKKERLMHRDFKNQQLLELKEEFKSLTKDTIKEDQKLKGLLKELKSIESANEECMNLNLVQLHGEMAETKKQISDIQKELKEDTKLKLHYGYMLDDMHGRIKVYCRIRGSGDKSVLRTTTGSHSVQVFLNEDVDSTNKNQDSHKTTFHFHSVFDSDYDNEAVFAYTEPLYAAANAGFNSYIIIMGGSETGKSYTMLGSEDRGLLYRGLARLRDILQTNKKNDLITRFHVSSFEIIDNKIYDLLADKMDDNLEPGIDCFKMSFVKHGKYQVCSEIFDMKNLLLSVLKNRANALQKLRIREEDSNFIFSIQIQVFDNVQHRFWKGRITNVRLGRFSANKSLVMTLQKLLLDKVYVPGPSKLCQFLRDAFGGSAKTCVIGCVSPSLKNLEESMGTMRMLQSLASITNEIYVCSESEQVYRQKNDIARKMRGANAEII